MRYTANETKKSATVKNVASARTPNNFSRMGSWVRAESSSFPRNKLGEYIKAFQPRSLKPYLLDAKGSINLEKIDTIEQYISAILNAYPGTFTITHKAFESLIENAKYWSAFGERRYDFDQLIIIQIAQLACSHCVVLRKEEVAPNADTDTRITQISTGIHTTSDLVKRR